MSVPIQQRLLQLSPQIFYYYANALIQTISLRISVLHVYNNYKIKSCNSKIKNKLLADKFKKIIFYLRIYHICTMMELHVLNLQVNIKNMYFLAVFQ